MANQIAGLFLKRDHVDFLIAEKHQSFLQSSAVDFGGRDQAYPRYIPKITSFQYLCNISRKR